MLALILSPKTVSNVSLIGRTTCFGNNWVFREVTRMSHISLKTDRMDHRERCWKTIASRVDLLNVIDSPNKGFLEILSNILVAKERSLSLTYGRTDESCSSFTLMYFGKCSASRINLFWSR